MSETASAQLRRVLQLIPHLADGVEHSIADVAAAVGIEPEQVLDDLASISERFDAPGGFVEGVSILVEQNTVCVTAQEFHRPMRLTMPELCALELGLVMLRRERTPVEQEPIDSALARLRRAITQVPANERHEGTRWAELAAADGGAHLPVIRSAIRSRHLLELGYRAGAATETTMRTVAPHALVFAEQMWYLVASSNGSGMRFFRLDRIEHSRETEQSFEPLPDAGAAVQAAGRAFAAESAPRMSVRYSPRIARWVAEREGATLADDGSLVMEHPVADESWAVRHVLQYGPDAEVLAPPELRVLVAAHLDRAAAQLG